MPRSRLLAWLLSLFLALSPAAVAGCGGNDAERGDEDSNQQPLPNEEDFEGPASGSGAGPDSGTNSDEDDAEE